VAATIACVDIALNLLLIPRYGMFGAATSTALAMATGAVLYAIVARRRLGLDISILQLLRSRA
jgi:O-antigen/teichoic acid export membrane protein